MMEGQLSPVDHFDAEGPRSHGFSIDDESLMEQSQKSTEPQGHNQSDVTLYSTLPQSDVLDVQLLSVFFDSYMPTNLAVWRQASYLRTIVEIVSNTILLKLAKRTLGLAHLAVCSRNDRIKDESRVSYGRLLSLLNGSLALDLRPGTRVDMREVVSTIALLTHICDYLQMPDQSNDNWVLHLEAARLLLVSKASTILKLDQPLDKGLIRHICHNSFYLSLARRQAWSMDSSWFKTESNGWTELSKVFHDLPTLLKETDRALSLNDTPLNLAALVHRLQKISLDAQTLFADVQHPKRMGASKAESPRLDTEELLFETGAVIFSSLYAPMSQVRALRFISVTLMSLIVQCTILRIWTFRPDSIMWITPEMQQATELESRRLACRLCRVAPSFTQRDQVVSILVLRLCLMLAFNVFEQQNVVPAMEWCRLCLLANQARLERVRQTGVPTLCKIEDILPGIAEAGRYGSIFDPEAFVIKTIPRRKAGTCD